MPRNLELKARDHDPERSLARALQQGAEDRGWMEQLDTYFCVPNGRLKLREQDDGTELIYYERSRDAVARESVYSLIPVEGPENLKAALADALGVLVSVEKSRHLLLWKNVRIHLDQVPGLGDFIELEAVAEPGSDLSEECEAIAELREVFDIGPKDILGTSYSDELLALRGAATD